MVVVSEIAMPEASMAEIWEVPCLRYEVSEDSIMRLIEEVCLPILDLEPIRIIS